MKQIVSKCILLILCIVMLTGFVYFDSSDEIETTGIHLSFKVEEEVIHAWNDGATYYLFLPSYAETNEVELDVFSDEFQVVDLNVIVTAGDSLAKVPIDERLTCKNTASNEVFHFCVMKSANLPTVFMETDSGSIDTIWADKDIEENGEIEVYSVTGENLYSDGLKGIKARGNYSFGNYAKKPFTITLKEGASLLGMGEGEKYALISNASDPTLIRNDIARKMDIALLAEHDNVGCFVDLYVNGEYLGNYYMCETIDVGAERVAITDLEAQMDVLYGKCNYESFEPYYTDTECAKYMDYNPIDITGGYLIEREFEDRYRLEYLDIPSNFKTDQGEHFMVESPMYCSDEQIDYLQNYFSEAETAIFASDGIHPVTKKSYEEYIDVDSFVKKYLVEEVTKNYDGGVSSVFMYKDSDSLDGRIKTAAIWDCDMSLGNYLEWMEEFAADPTGISKLAHQEHGSFWYEALYDKKEVYDKIVEYYNDLAVPYLDWLLEEGIEDYRVKFQASATMNEIRWEKDFDNNQYFKDRDTSFDKLSWFIAERKTYLDSVWK